MEPQDLLLTLSKRQFDTTLRMTEAWVEAVMRVCEIQLEAAAGALAAAAATQRKLADVTNAAELYALRTEWLLGNVRESMCCWSRLLDVALDAKGRIAECACSTTLRVRGALPARDPSGSPARTLA